MNDREGPGSLNAFSRNWLILFFVVILISMAAFLLGLVAGTDAGSTATEVGLTIISVFALVDGGWRLLGNEGFLGTGRGFDRLLACIQILLALAVIARSII